MTTRPIVGPTPPRTARSTRGPARKTAEAVGGAANALFSLPRAAIPAAILGGMKAKDQLDPSEVRVTQEKVAKLYAVGGAAQSVAQAAIVGLIFGPMVAAAMMLSDGTREAVSLIPFLKGGGADQIGKDISEAVEKVVKPGDDPKEAIGKGRWAAVKTAVGSSYRVRFEEGMGIVGGIIDGANRVPDILFPKSADGSEVTDQARSSLQMMKDAASLAKRGIDVPAHYVQGMFQGFDPGSDWTKSDFMKSRAGTLALVGLTVGMFVGAPFLAAGVGGGVALLNGLFDDDEDIEKKIDSITQAARRGMEELDTELPVEKNELEAGFMAAAEILSRKGVLTSGESGESSHLEKLKKILDAPGHIGQALVQGTDPEVDWDSYDFAKSRVAGLAVVGLAIGLALGAPFLAAAVGAGAGVASRLFDDQEALEQIISNIAEVAREVHAETPKVASEITRKNHQGMHNGIVAAARGLRES